MLFLELMVLGDIMLAKRTAMEFLEMVQDLSVPYFSGANWTLLDILPAFVEVIAGVGMEALLHMGYVLGTPVDPRLPLV